MTDTYDQVLQNAVKENKLSSEALASLKLWLTNEAFVDFKPELLSLIKNEDWHYLEDAFYTRIRVGTGGIRGPLGVGPNRINTRTIGEAAQALSNFIHGFGKEAVDGGIVIGHEVRKQSRDFAEMCCEVFAANGIKSYLFDHYRSTPELSFAVRQLAVTAGVQLTASHNPRTDNGFKFYWSDGGQVVPPLDLKFMELVTNVSEIKRLPFSEAKQRGLVKEIGDEVDEPYFEAVLKQSLSGANSASVTFSPMHGAGSTNVLPILNKKGFAVTTVVEQSEPDENFPTAAGDLINPEFPEVMRLALEQAAASGSDLAIMSDPDADRIGVAAKNALNNPEMTKLSGNEVGIALTHYILSSLKKQGKLSSNSLVIETYVTSSLISKVARSFDIKVRDELLVGFKFIGEIITALENPEDFIFAAEESLGYLRGDYARDKDAAVAGMLIAELTSECKERGKSILDYLDDIYLQYGYFKNLLLPAELGQGRAGKEQIVKVMLGLRSNPPKQLGGLDILEIKDELPDAQRLPDQYTAAATGDQITFVLSDDGLTRVTARPSGTEPIIKFYSQHWMDVKGNLGSVKQKVDSQTKALQDDIEKYCNQFMA